MIKYGIPEEVIGGFIKLVSLSAENEIILEEIIKQIKIGDSPIVVGENNFHKFDNLTDIDLIEILVSMYSLVNIFVESNDSVEIFSSDFSQSYKEINKINNIEVAEKDVFSLKNKLIKYLPLFNNIKITIKARDLRLNSPSIFKNSKIITDIRMIFDNDFSNKEQYAIIIHQLNITKTEGENTIETYISLDSNDLIKLKDSIDRALLKEDSIKKHNHNINYISLN